MGRIVEHRPVVEDDRGKALRVDRMCVQQLAALVRVGIEEAERNGVPANRIAQGVTPRRPALADDPKDGVSRAIGARPGGERLLDLRVEQLLGRGPALQEPEVDAPERRRMLQGIQGAERNTGTTAIHGHEQSAHSAPVERASPREELDAAHARQVEVGSYERDGVAGVRQALECGEPGRGRIGGEDAVVRCEAP